MNAETLNCPMCGAPASSDATQCEHCGARLATVACPSCFGMIFVGSKFCSHCGARADRTEAETQTHLPCPRCHVDLNAVVIGKTNLRECPQCEGIWADAASLEAIRADREQQAAVLGIAGPVAPEPGDIEKQIRYVPCPVCHKLMNRVNFAHCSHVVVDVCARHGTWFDKDELRRIVEFIRGGGLEAARQKQLDELETKERELRTAKIASAWSDRADDSRTKYADWHLGISSAAGLLNDLLAGKRGLF